MLYSPIATKEKALAYITRKSSLDNSYELLVFDHDKHWSEAGTQVVGGGIKGNETHEDALLRECFEESGLTHLKVIKKFDEYVIYRPIHRLFNHRHCYILESEISLPDSWTHKVSGNGKDKNMNFHFYWIPLSEAKEKLVGTMSYSLPKLLP